MHTGAARRSHTRLRLAGLVLGLSHFAGCATTQESPKVSEAAARWAADLAKFEEQVGGKWDVREEENEAGTRRTVFEVGDNPVIKGWGEGGEKQARAIADKLLESNAKLLRIAGLATEMHMVGRTGKAFAFVYSVGQPHAKHRRIPILGARVDVRIHELGRILLLRSDVPELAEDPLPEKPADQAQFDELDKKAAQACDLSQPRVDGDKRTARLVYRRAKGQRQAIPLWEVPVSSRPEGAVDKFGFVYLPVQGDRKPEFVSAKFKVGSHQPADSRSSPACDTVEQGPSLAGKVSGWCRVGLAPNSRPVPTPLANLHVFNPGNPGTAAMTTDNNGGFTPPLPPNPQFTPLAGASCTVLGPNPPVVAVATNGLTVDLGSDGAADQVAHMTAYYWIDQASQHCCPLLKLETTQDARNKLAELAAVKAWVNQPWVADPDFEPAWSWPGTMYFACGNGPRPNMAYSTIVLHEWGHHLISLFAIGEGSDGLREGWADVVAMFVAKTSCVGPGYLTPGNCLRSGLDKAQFGVGGNEHDMGKSWMGFAWILRTKLVGKYPAEGIAIANELLIGTIPTGVCYQPDAVEAVFIAADEDGRRRGDYLGLLREACAEHALPVPDKYKSP